MKWEADQEFPWVDVCMETRDIRCNVCQINGTTNDWINFLSEHQNCEDIRDYPRTLDEVKRDRYKDALIHILHVDEWRHTNAEISLEEVAEIAFKALNENDS